MPLWQGGKMQIIALVIWLAILIYPAQADVLQGGIQHSEYLPQMPAQLQAGSAYQDAPMQTTSIKWYPLPTWLRGVYQSDFITNQVVQVYSSAAPPHQAYGKMKHTDSYGLQLDNQGRLWNADLLPKVGKWEGAQVEVQTTVEKDCVTSDDNQLIMHIHNYCVYLSPTKQQIVYAEQVDGFKTIKLQNKQGDLSIYDDIQEYDSNGQPLDRYIATSTMHRTKIFKPQDFENGIDLRASLAQYLTSTGHPELIPGSNTPVEPQMKSGATPDGNFSSAFGNPNPNASPGSYPNADTTAYPNPNVNSYPEPGTNRYPKVDSNPIQAMPSPVNKQDDTGVGF